MLYEENFAWNVLFVLEYEGSFCAVIKKCKTV